MSLLKSAATVSILTLVSRIFGYIRDIFIASILGAGMLADTFLVAYRLPNFFRQLSAEGAVNNAFVPLFSSKMVAEGKDKASVFASQVFSWLFVILSLLTIVMVIFMPYVMSVLAYGYADQPEKMALVVTFGRIVFPYLLLISMVSLLAGMLQSVGKFAVAAAAPVILNICMVSAILIGGYLTKIPAHILCFGVVAAGICQLVWVWCAVRKAQIHLKFCRLTPTEDIKLLFKRMVPGIIGGGVTQLNLWVNTIVATNIAGAVAYLYYADRIVQFPLALIGTAMGVALLPTLSRALKANQIGEAVELQNRALEISLLLAIPAAVGLYAIAGHLIQGMFQRGAFSNTETIATAAALKIYAIGLPAFVLIKIFLPSYFAAGDTKTPVKIGLVCLGLNALLSITLVQIWGHRGLAAATTASSWLNAALLIGILMHSERYTPDAALYKGLRRIAMASLAMLITIKGVDALLLEKTWLQDSPNLQAIAVLGALLSAGSAVFLLTAFLNGATGIIKVLWKR
jgi:putative peptidoglycan lipid II flippase